MSWSECANRICRRCKTDRSSDISINQVRGMNGMDCGSELSKNFIHVAIDIGLRQIRDLLTCHDCKSENFFIVFRFRSS